MPPAGGLLPPSSSLPPLRTLEGLAEKQLFTALDNLTRLYCPLSFYLKPLDKKLAEVTLADSGYSSGTEEDDADDDPLTAIRADGFERSFAERWLTGFMARAEMLDCFDSEESRERAVDQASCVLESFHCNAAKDEQKGEELADYVREFSFDVAPLHSSEEGRQTTIGVKLNDGLAGQKSDEADDVGLQSWSAAIVFCQLMCADPERFGISKQNVSSYTRIIELGAGTGLVSLVLARLLPHFGADNATIIATDYHPAVLENLRANIDTNFPTSHPGAVEAALLDWSRPSRDPPFHLPADFLFATDVVYAPEHALWLRDCASGLLAPGGVFWLVVAMRSTGRFEGVSDTLRTPFAAEDGPESQDGRRLRILHEERLDKRKGLGRGDENGYILLRIGWV